MCFRKTIYLFGLLIFLASCRSNYAVLYDSAPVFEKKAKVEKLSLTSDKKLVGSSFKLEVAKPKFKEEVKPLPKYFPPVKAKIYKEVLSPFKEFTKLPIKVLKQDPVKKAKEKKKRKRRRFWRKTGSNLFIGFFFLGVAVVLTLVHLESLAALFGLASILFLFFGLKKFFKKRNRGIKNPFKKKI